MRMPDGYVKMLFTMSMPFFIPPQFIQDAVVGNLTGRTLLMTISAIVMVFVP